MADEESAAPTVSISTLFRETEQFTGIRMPIARGDFGLMSDYMGSHARIY